jgi:hypothetical protein
MTNRFLPLLVFAVLLPIVAAACTSEVPRDLPPPRPADGNRYKHAVVDALPDGPQLAWNCWQGDAGCVSPNPNVWWVRWNDSQGTSRVQYRFLAPGFVTEARFYEAVQLLWAWPEGKFLLREAASPGVVVVGGSPADLQNNYADFTPVGGYRIRFNDRFLKVSTFMVSTVLAHELQHLADAKNGVAQGWSVADYCARERRAYQTQARFLRWVEWKAGKLPSRDEVGKALSAEDNEWFANFMRLASAGEQAIDTVALNDYRQCRNGHPSVVRGTIGAR